METHDTSALLGVAKILGWGLVFVLVLAALFTGVWFLIAVAIAAGGGLMFAGSGKAARHES